MFELPFILSVAPFILFLFLLLWRKMPLLKVSVITLVLVTGLAFLYWKIIPAFLLISYAKGFFVALDIFLIILGAIFFLEVLRYFKVIDAISYYLGSFSKDYRVQVILLAWFFENLLEGTAGFGVPAAVVAPILIALGLSPLKAVILGLLGNSAAGIFGAAGTPIRVGLAGLDVSGVAQTAAWINCLGLLVPVFMLWILTRDKTDRNKQFLEALPFAIWSGIAFVVPSVLTVALGQEFPSILGSVIGLLLILVTSRFNIFMPKNIRLAPGIINHLIPPPLFKTVFPYVLLVIFLFVGKFLLGGLNILIQFGDFKHTFSLFNPGWVFIIVGLLTVWTWQNKTTVVLGSIKTAFIRALGPFFVIICMSAIVQIMINAGQNFSGFDSPIVLVAKIFETSFLPFWAPFLGAFGAFITGSVTISNIMFGNLLSVAAGVLGLSTAKILAVGIVGAAAGNMIALADILSAEAVVGLKNEERQVLRGVIIPCFIYVALAGLVGMLII